MKQCIVTNNNLNTTEQLRIPSNKHLLFLTIVHDVSVRLCYYYSDLHHSSVITRHIVTTIIIRSQHTYPIPRLPHLLLPLSSRTSSSCTPPTSCLLLRRLLPTSRLCLSPLPLILLLSHSITRIPPLLPSSSQLSSSSSSGKTLNNLALTLRAPSPPLLLGLVSSSSW